MYTSFGCVVLWLSEAFCLRVMNLFCCIVHVCCQPPVMHRRSKLTASVDTVCMYAPSASSSVSYTPNDTRTIVPPSFSVSIRACHRPELRRRMPRQSHCARLAIPLPGTACLFGACTSLFHLCIRQVATCLSVMSEKRKHTDGFVSVYDFACNGPDENVCRAMACSSCPSRREQRWCG